MSVSALTTAMAVAAAAVPNEAPPPVVESAPEPVSLVHDPLKVPTAAESKTTPSMLAQSTEPPRSSEPDQSTELAELTEAVQTTEPALSAQPQPQPQPQPHPQAPAPVGESTDIVVTGRKPVPEDPLVELNSKSFEVAQSVDESIIAPIAFAYGEVMPHPVRKGLSNFLHNLGEPVVFLNFLLQLKFDEAAETLGRFAINTTLGAGGLVDVAKRKPFNLPHRDNGFANTLGYYGVKPGPYFYLPLVGPTTLRDFIGGRLDLLLLPSALPKLFRKPEVVIPVWVLKELGRRIEFDDELREIRATRDPYVAARVYYLQKRQAEIDALHRRGTSTTKSSPTPPTSDASGVSGFGGGSNLQLVSTGKLLSELSILGAASHPNLLRGLKQTSIISGATVSKNWPSYTF